MITLNTNIIFGNLCIDISLWDKNVKQFKKVTALFDTGAHITHIDTFILESLGYDLSDAGTTYVSSVGSQNMKINNTVIDNIKIGELELGAVLVNFSELSDVNCPVILGLNVIKEFDVELSFKNSTIFMKPNFDVNSSIPVKNFIKSDSRFGIWTIGADN